MESQVDIREVQTVYVAQIMPENPDNPTRIYTEQLGTSKSAAKQKALEVVDEFDSVPKATLHNLVWDEDHIKMDGVIFNIRERTLYEEA